MDISADALDIVCKHLDARSIVQLAGTNKETRKHVLASRHRVDDFKPFHIPIGWISEQIDFAGGIIEAGCGAVCAAWCPQSKRIAYGDLTSQGAIYDCDTARMLDQSHPGFGWFVQWSPDGTKVMSASGYDSVHVWDVTTGVETRMAPRNFRLTCICWSPDGTKIATGSYHGFILVWDAATDTELLWPAWIHRAWVTCVAWSPDGTKILSGCGDGKVVIWCAMTGAALHVFQDRCYSITHNAWCPDGVRILSFADGDIMCIWDANTGQCTHSMPNTKIMRCMDWSPNGSRLVSYASDAISIWNTHTWVKTYTLPCNGKLPSWLAWSPDGTKIVCTFYYDFIRIWNVRESQ